MLEDEPNEMEKKTTTTIRIREMCASAFLFYLLCERDIEAHAQLTQLKTYE